LVGIGTGLIAVSGRDVDYLGFFGITRNLDHLFNLAPIFFMYIKWHLKYDYACKYL
jgi:hypothetical protein